MAKCSILIWQGSWICFWQLTCTERQKSEYTQWVFTCSKPKMKTLEQGVQSVQSWKKTLEPPCWLQDIKKHWCCSCVSIVYFEKIPYLFLVFILEFQELLPAEFTNEVQTNKNYVTCNDRCKLRDINQTGQTASWKETCIKFNKYAECRLWANIYEIYWDFCSARVISLPEKKNVWKPSQWPSLIVLICDVLTCI